MSLAIRHNLLQGFGVKLNDRFIRIAQINISGIAGAFRSQLLDLTASVLNLYWDLVSANDELKVRQSALEMTRKFRGGHAEGNRRGRHAARGTCRAPKPRPPAVCTMLSSAQYDVRQRETSAEGRFNPHAGSRDRSR